MPISSYKLPQKMRMSFSSQQLLQELALKASCDYNPDKQDIKELSENSMQCLTNNVTDKEDITNKSITKFEEKKKLDQIITEHKTTQNNILGLSSIQRNHIPYPDHNYGQPPPLTPPAEGIKILSEVALQSKLKNVSTNQPSKHTTSNNTDEEQGVTRCICGFEHDDGYMICCDDCSSWQHIDCMGIESNKVPETYSCHKCNPRVLDIERAKALQKKKRENMSEGDDDDDDEEEHETASEDESGKTMYTAISNTPTRITLLSNSHNPLASLKQKNKKGSRVQKRKLSDQRHPRSKKVKKRERNDEITGINDDLDVTFIDSEAYSNFFSSYKLYEEINENKYDKEFQNMHFKLPEAIHSIDFKRMERCHTVSDITPNRKGLFASSFIPPGVCVIEYKGTLLSKQKFETLNPMLNKCCPYVASYNKIDTLPLVVDARVYGNDARFVRRSCTPNADLRHITSSGSLHIMMISCHDIVKDSEITIPFDYPIESYKGYIECACGDELCTVQQHNNEWKKNSITENDVSLIQIMNTDSLTMNKTENETMVESESELNSLESKHEKLSREERKLQAVIKQFEKLEKRKIKEPKTPGNRLSTEENISLGNGTVTKPLLIKKISGSKRKMSFSGKRRTRQSSCSSEPVSPIENESNGVSSTPTTPLSSSHPQTLFDPHVVAKIRGRREKEPLTLSLPIHRKLKHETSLTSPTPPSTPVHHLSPSKALNESSTFALSLDTQSLLESTPLKGGFGNGLLQIATITPSSMSVCSSHGLSTAEEKMGDLTTRLGDIQPFSPIKESRTQRKYYGSLKKHWLNKHSKKKTCSLKEQFNGSSAQLSIAALIASLSQQQHLQNISALSPATVFKRPQSFIPIKKRHLQNMIKSVNSYKGNKQPVDLYPSQNDICRTNSTQAVKNSNVELKTENSQSIIDNSLSSVCDIKSSNTSKSNETFIKEIHENPFKNPSPTTKEPQILQMSKDEQYSHQENVSSIQTTDRMEERKNCDETCHTPNIKSVLKRSYVKNKHGSVTNEPEVKQARTDSSDESSSDTGGLKIVISEASPIKLPFKSSSTLHEVTAKVENTTIDVPKQQATVSSVTDISNTCHSRSVPTSPRSSVDSNADSEHSVNTTVDDHSSSGKKKLSFKEYRNRRNQRNVNNTSQHSTNNDESLSSNTTISNVKANQPAISNAEDLLLPRTLSLRETEINAKIKLPEYSRAQLKLPEYSRTQTKPEPINGVGKLDSIKRNSYERTVSVSSNNSVFEPVSPGNESTSGSPSQDDTAFNNIHTEITKSQLNIPDDIPKHQLGEKTNPSGPGLLQLLSAQKYPHLASITNTQSIVNSTQSIQTQASGGSFRHQLPSEYRSNDTVDNDDDTSSTHSSVSSTSYGSISDVNHDRSSFINHRTSYAREYGSRDHTFYHSQPVSTNFSPHQPYYSPFSQHMHPTNSRPANNQRNMVFNSYQQPSRHRQNNRTYPPFQ